MHGLHLHDYTSSRLFRLVTLCVCSIFFTHCKSSSIWGCHCVLSWVQGVQICEWNSPPFMVLVELSRQEELDLILLWFPLFSFSCYFSFSMNCEWESSPQCVSRSAMLVIRRLLAIKQTHVSRKCKYWIICFWIKLMPRSLECMSNQTVPNASYL